MILENLHNISNILSDNGVKHAFLLDRDDDNPRDLDVIVNRDDLISSTKVLRSKLVLQGYLLINFVKNSYVWQLYFYCKTNKKTIQIDLMPEISTRGVVYADSKTILNDLVIINEIPFVRNDIYLAVKIIRDLILQKKVSDKVLSKIKSSGITVVPKEFRVLLGNDFDFFLNDKCFENYYMYKKIILNSIKQKPIDFLIRKSNNYFCKIQRYFNYPGLFVAFLGPDGSGKTSAINSFMATAKIFDCEKFYLVPGFFKRYQISSTGNGSPEINPHGRKNKGKLFSIVKQWVWLFEYIGGYYTVLIKHLFLGKCIVFDRYYSDFIVDKKRYRYSGPDWYVKACYNLMPKPDITLVMHTTPEIVQSRKQEVSFEESLNQLNNYYNLKNQLENTFIIDTTESIEKVTDEIIELLLQKQSIRANQRLSLLK